MALSIAEVLEDVAKAKTREDKRDVLKKNDSWSLKALLQQNFHPDATWLIPPGAPPYNEHQTSADTSLMFEAYGKKRSEVCYFIGTIESRRSTNTHCR